MIYIKRLKTKNKENQRLLSISPSKKDKACLT